jgi:hypothetical protein
LRLDDPCGEAGYGGEIIMQTFRRRARLTPAVLAAAVIAGGLAASPALAGLARAAIPAQDVTWTVTPGGNVKGESGPVLLEDTVTGGTVRCASSVAAGVLESGSGLPGPGLGSVTSVTYTKCADPSGLAFTISASAATDNPWRLNAKSYDASSAVTTGTITNITATLGGSGCQAVLAGPAVTVPGAVKITYANGTHRLRLLDAGGTLHFWNVSGCTGLFGQGDPATLSVCYPITPPQTIMSTPPDPGPDTTGTGPPC